MIDSELRARIVSAVILGVLVLFLTWLGGVWFRILSVTIALFIHYEFTGIIHSRDRDPAGFIIGWAGLAGAAILILFDLQFLALVAVFATAVLAALPSVMRGEGVWSATAVLYAGLFAVILAEIRGGHLLGLFAMAFIFAIVWATDILAYFCGRTLGGRKLAPSISPGKTWSGAIFGAAAGVAAGMMVVLSLRPGGSLLVPFIALALAVSSEIGDLFESWVKRRFGVKDSSHLIPGHGGVMDRVDGLVFAAFAAFLLALVLPEPTVFAGNGELAARLLGQ